MLMNILNIFLSLQGHFCAKSIPLCKFDDLRETKIKETTKEKQIETDPTQNCLKFIKKSQSFSMMYDSNLFSSATLHILTKFLMNISL